MDKEEKAGKNGGMCSTGKKEDPFSDSPFPSADCSSLPLSLSNLTDGIRKFMAGAAAAGRMAGQVCKRRKISPFEVERGEKGRKVQQLLLLCAPAREEGKKEPNHSPRSILDASTVQKKVQNDVKA